MNWTITCIYLFVILESFIGCAVVQDVRPLTTSPPLGEAQSVHDIQLFLTNQIDITAAVAKQAFSSTRQQIRRLRSIVKDKSAIRETVCPFRGADMYPCIHELYKSHYLFPFPVALPHQVRRHEMMSPRFDWVPAHHTREGLALVTEWKRVARTGKRVDCEGERCRLIIDFQNKMNEDMLAVCDIIHQPHAKVELVQVCQPLAILTPEIWLRAVVGYKYTSRRQFGSFFTFTIASHDLDEKDVFDAGKQAMEAPPLALKSNMGRETEKYTLRFEEMFRESHLLGKSYRENLEIYMNVWKPDRTNRISLIANVTLLIFKQNEIGGFGIAKDMRRSLYEEKIQEKFHEELGKLCDNSGWDDSQQLKCQPLPEEIVLAQ